MLERTRARRQALQMLYQREITGDSIGVILSSQSYCVEDGQPDEFCRGLALGAEAHLPAVDATIGEVSENWSVSRMPLVDRNILRLATYELLFVDDVPTSVSINEAVELAKVFGGEDSSKFVNGVLGRIAEKHGEQKGREASDD